MLYIDITYLDAQSKQDCALEKLTDAHRHMDRKLSLLQDGLHSLANHLSSLEKRLLRTHDIRSQCRYQPSYNAQYHQQRKP